MKTILVGTDFTASSMNACRYAARLAKHTGANLVVFNLFEAPVFHANEGLMGINLATLEADSRHLITRLLKRLQPEFPGVIMSGLTASGSFSGELQRFVSKHQVGAVVMGMAVKGRISRFIFGSHGADIGGQIDVPVIIVPERYKEHKVKNMIVAVDNAHLPSGKVIRHIDRIIKSLNVKVTAIHVRTPNELILPLKPPVLSMAGNKFTVQNVDAPDIESGVKKYIRAHEHDLVLIVSRHHSAIYRMFAETSTKRVAFASNVPVIAIHD